MAIRDGREWDVAEGLGVAEPTVARLSRRTCRSTPRAGGASSADVVTVPATLAFTPARTMSTQEGFGKIMAEIARRDDAFAQRIVTLSPDVSVSTNLGPWINRRGLFARDDVRDVFHDEKVVSAQKWMMSRSGQHIELGIAENNLFIMLAALGLSSSLFGERLLPVGTLYDPFIARGLDSLNYACYQNARFLLVATPSGLALAPEGGAHQSIGTPLIGIAQDGLAAFEPAFVDELAAIMAWSFDYMQRGGEGEPNERNWLRDETGGSVYLRLSTRPLEQIARTVSRELASDIVDGAYWLRPPGPACEVVIVYQGTVAAEAIEAAGRLSEVAARRRRARRDIGRPALGRMARGGARAPARHSRRALPCRAASSRRAARRWPRHSSGRPPDHAVLARRGGGASREAARCRAFRAVGHDTRSVPPLRHRRQRDRPRGRRGLAGPARALYVGPGLRRSTLEHCRHLGHGRCRHWALECVHFAQGRA